MSNWTFPASRAPSGPPWQLMGLELLNQTIVSNVTARSTRACIMISSSLVTEDPPITPLTARFAARFPPTFLAVEPFRNAMAHTCPTRVDHEDKLLKELGFSRGSYGAPQTFRT